MLTALTTRSAKLTPLSKQLEQVTEKATTVTDKLDDIARRLAALDDRTQELEEVDKRIQALKDAAARRELTTQKAIGPDGELHKHREAVQHLSSQALQTQAVLDTLKKERTALEELRGQLREPEGREVGARPCRHAQGRARSGSHDGLVTPAGLHEDSRDVAGSARRHDRRDGDGQGSREEARAARAASRAEPEHRGAAERRSTRSPSTCRARPRRSRASSRPSSMRSCRPTASTRWSGRWTCRSAS